MEIPAYFLNPSSCEGKTTTNKNDFGILLCLDFEMEDIGKEIIGIVTKKFSGQVPKIPVALTKHLDILNEGDYVKFLNGKLELPGVECKYVVSAFIKKHGKILLLKRSDKVGTFQGMWATVSGYIEEGDTPLSRARKEIIEETGIKKARLVKKGEVVLARSGHRVFAIYPFLFETEENVSIDWEHTEYAWVEIEEINSYKTVPKLMEALMSVI